jgi:LmbE family N-acetylglucosaminyl deacetylase
MSVILFLSPHLDDAAFSCAGRILSEVRKGNRVIVATVFSHCGDDKENVVLYERRRDEDCRAGKILGAEMIWLGSLDAPFRSAYYNSFQRIVFGRHRRDQGSVAEVAQVIGGLSRQLTPARIYCPLGVGTHIDHRLVHEAARLNRLDGQVVFYEDRPYALVEHAVRLRLLEIGAEIGTRRHVKDLRGGDSASIWREFWASFLVAPYVQRYLPAGKEREVCLDKLRRTLRRGPQKPDFRLKPEIEICEGVGLGKVAKAVSVYQTQVGAFLGGRREFRSANRRYARRVKAETEYLERYWLVAG